MTHKRPRLAVESKDGRKAKVRSNRDHGAARRYRRLVGQKKRHRGMRSGATS